MKSCIHHCLTITHTDRWYMYVAHASMISIDRHLEINKQTLNLVPRPIPSFSMLSACNIEKLGERAWGWGYFKGVAKLHQEDVGIASVNFWLVELLWLYNHHHPCFVTFCRPVIPKSWRMFLLSLLQTVLLALPAVYYMVELVVWLYGFCVNVYIMYFLEFSPPLNCSCTNSLAGAGWNKPHPWIVPATCACTIIERVWLNLEWFSQLE